MLLPVLLLTLSSTSRPAPPPAGETLQAIDVYGNRSLSREALIAALGVDVGAASDFDRGAAEDRLRALDGVFDAEVVLMSMPGRHSLMVGVEELGAPRLAWLPTPDGRERLPEVLVQLYEATLELTLEGLMAGEGGEQVRDGYGLSEYTPARERELELIELARGQAERLPQVLREAADAHHRAVAAACVAYLPDKQQVQELLVEAMLDADAGVRNNATRGLLVLAKWANGQPDFSVELDPAPLLTLLESVRWTDRNKATALLLHLTESRRPELLEAVRASSVPALAEMAAWSIDGYSYPALMVLGRLAGEEDAALVQRQTQLQGERRSAWVEELARRALDAPD